MNLFVLDRDPVEAARQNCDKHVCKIVLEAAQMLGLAHQVYNPAVPTWMYNAHTHRNNHVSKWVRETLANYRWTVAHGLALAAEYTRRYGKTHGEASRKPGRATPLDVLLWCRDNEPAIPDLPLTEFRQAVAEDCYRPDVVEAYRLYYIRYKSRFAKWRSGPYLDWYRDGVIKEFGRATVG